MKTTKWTIDPKQSEIAFIVRKLMITNVHGKFAVFKGGLETESEDFESLKNIQFQAKIDSIKTDDEKRDEHLKSSDFFDMDVYPYLSFKAKRYSVKDQKLEGELSIRDTTKPITLDAEFYGTSNNENGESSPCLRISGKIKRQDFGLSWNGKNQAGEIIVGEDISLNAQVSFIKQPALVEEAQDARA